MFNNEEMHTFLFGFRPASGLSHRRVSWWRLVVESFAHAFIKDWQLLLTEPKYLEGFLVMEKKNSFCTCTRDCIFWLVKMTWLIQEMVTFISIFSFLGILKDPLLSLDDYVGGRERHFIVYLPWWVIRSSRYI